VRVKLVSHSAQMWYFAPIFTDLIDISCSETKKKKIPRIFELWMLRQPFGNHNKPMLVSIQLIQELTVVGVQNLGRGRGRRGKGHRHSRDDSLMSCRSGKGFCKARSEEVWIDKDVMT